MAAPTPKQMCAKTFDLHQIKRLFFLRIGLSVLAIASYHLWPKRMAVLEFIFFCPEYCQQFQFKLLKSTYPNACVSVFSGACHRQYLSFFSCRPFIRQGPVIAQTYLFHCKTLTNTPIGKQSITHGFVDINKRNKHSRDINKQKKGKVFQK